MSWPIYNDTITCKCGEELDPLEICECKQKERQHDSAVLSTPRTSVQLSNMCGKDVCNVSQGIHSIPPSYPGFTFGTGELDEFGYWSEPCYECARQHEKKHPEDGK